MLIFTAVLDTNGDASTTSGDFKAARITNLGTKSKFFAIHPSLTVDGNGKEWIHCIYAIEDDVTAWYVRVTADDSSYASYTAHRISSDNLFTTYSAGFAQSLSG